MLITDFVRLRRLRRRVGRRTRLRSQRKSTSIRDLSGTFRTCEVCFWRCSLPFCSDSRHSKVISNSYGSPNLAGLFRTLTPRRETTDIFGEIDQYFTDVWFDSWRVITQKRSSICNHDRHLVAFDEKSSKNLMNVEFRWVHALEVVALTAISITVRVDAPEG